MSNNCPIMGPNPKCQYCGCTGKGCQSLFPGMKVEWPELKGVSGLQAKATIESDNPHVTAWVVRESSHFIAVICCNRVILCVPDDDCPNGPVLNRPQIG